jgi:hypothetical protein
MRTDFCSHRLVGAQCPTEQFTFQLTFPNVNLKRTPLLVYTVILLFWIVPGNAQNLILNGDFESGPHDGVGTIIDWTVSGTGFADSAMEGATSGNFSAALNIAGDSEGNTLSQTFTTVSGQAYEVEFDAGIFGTRNNAPLRLNVRLTGTGTLLDQIVTPPDAFTTSVGQVVFHHYHYFFTADDSTTNLQFTDIGLGNGGADTVVDTASVYPATLPPPTTLPLANFDFESGPFNVNGTVTGWSASGAARIANLDEAATTGSHSVAFGPGGDFQDDILSQRFFTTSGRQYVVDFDAAIFGVAGLSQMLRIGVTGSTAVLDQVVSPPYYASFDSSAIQFQHYHFLFTADSSVSILEFSDIGFENTDADILVDSVSIAPVPPTFSEWQALHFTSDQLTDPQTSGWTADPDHDDLGNGLEYFFGTDPLAGITASDANLLPRMGVEVVNSSPYVTYTFRRLLGWTGNAPVVGVSDNLISWDETGAQLESAAPIVPSGDGVTEIVKIRLTTPIDQGPIKRKFLRLALPQ